MTVKKFGRLSVCVFALAFGQVAFGVDYDVNPDDDTATIQAAIDAADPGTTLTFAPGEYPLTAALSIPSGKSVTLLGTGYTNCVLRQTTAEVRVMTIASADAIVDGFTITGGSLASTSQGAGVHMTGGLVRNCRLTKNKNGTREKGLGAYMTGGTLSHCIVDSNGDPTINYASAGAGVYIAGNNVTVDTCLIYGNTTKGKSTMTVGFTMCNQGGGIYVESKTGVKILNSTITSNTAPNGGGGIYCAGTGVTVKNCIVADNITSATDSSEGKPNWGCGGNAEIWANNVSYCLWGNKDTCKRLGAPSWDGDPGFVDAENGDYTLVPGALAIGKGLYYEGIPADLRGVERRDPSDLGCYQSAGALPLSCSASVSPDKAMVGSTFSFAGVVENVREGADYIYCWTLTDLEGKRRTFTTDVLTLDKALAEPGDYEVMFSVTNLADETDCAYAYTPGRLLVVPQTNYVTSAKGATPVRPYATPETAAASIHDALDVALPGCVVQLNAGEHAVSKTIEIKTNLTVRGVGRELTVLRASGSGYRLCSLNNAEAVVEDLTLTGAQYSDPGACVYVNPSGGRVINCALVGNLLDAANREGCAIRTDSPNALIDRCIISCNTNASSTYAWGVVRGTVYMKGGIIRNSLISRNVLLYRTDATSNSGDVIHLEGSGTKMENCTVVDNVDNCNNGCAVNLSKSAQMVNVIMAGNQTPNVSIPSGSVLPNLRGGSVATIKNCYYGGSASYGTDCLSGDDAGFVDAEHGDWHLLPTSPCRNKGCFLEWMTGAVDLDGKQRVMGPRPEIGCYEIGPLGLMLMLK